MGGRDRNEVDVWVVVAADAGVAGDGAFEHVAHEALRSLMQSTLACTLHYLVEVGVQPDVSGMQVVAELGGLQALGGANSCKPGIGSLQLPAKLAGQVVDGLLMGLLLGFLAALRSACLPPAKALQLSQLLAQACGSQIRPALDGSVMEAVLLKPSFAQSAALFVGRPQQQ